MSKEAPVMGSPTITHAARAMHRNRPRRWISPSTRRFVLGAGGIIAFVLLWQIATVLLEIPAFLLPQPVDLARGIIANREVLFRALRILLAEAIGGFVLGNASGILLAFLVNRSVTLRATLLPLALTIRSTPIVAITPLITLILGFGYVTTITVAALICFFPMFVNVSRGLEAVPPQALQLFRLLDTSAWNTFWKLRFPSALPYLFAALRVTGPASIIGAMVAEFIASDKGLGFLILISYSSYRFAVMWQAIIVTTLCSVLVFTLVGVAEKLIIPWHRSE